MLIIPILCWGMAYPAFVKGTVDLGNALQAKGPMAGLLFNTLQSFVAMIAWAIMFPRSLTKLNPKVLWRGALLGFLLAAGYAANTYAYFYGYSNELGDRVGGIVAFFNALYVILIPLILLATMGYRPAPSFFAGAIVVLAGVYIMTNPLRGGFGLIEFLGLSCAFTFSLQILFIDKFSREVEIGPLMMAKVMGYFVTFLVATLVFLPFYGDGLTVGKVFSAITARNEAGHLNNVLWGFLYAGLFATVLAQFLQLKYQKDIHPTHAAVLYNLTPAMALIFLFFFADEAFLLPEGQGTVGPYSKLIGAGLILAGNIACELGRVWASRRKAAS